MLLSVVVALATGRAEALLPGALAGAADAVSLTLKLAAGYLFFCGMMEIVKALHVPEKMSKALAPALRRLFPGVKEKDTQEAMVLNLTADLLGLGNAATPTGIAAMERMEREQQRDPAVLHAMYLFLVINATSVQLLPTTVISLRVAAQAADPTAILLPTWACTSLSMAVGMVSAWLWGKRQQRKGALYGHSATG